MAKEVKNMSKASKQYRLIKQIGDLKEGTILELKGCVYVNGAAAFEASYVWTDTEYFQKV